MRRKHLWEDALNRFKGGLDFTKYICISFVGEPAVDEGRPFREFLHLLIGSIATNNSLFCGKDDCQVSAPNMVELTNKTHLHVGEMIAVSLVHGDPARVFFTPSLADYILYSLHKVKVTTDEVLCLDIVTKGEYVSVYIIMYDCVTYMYIHVSCITEKPQ